MTEISAKLVKELRDQTGAGMMDCKRALVETEGDVEAARKLLREKGMAQAAKRAGRETTEGVVIAEIDGNKGVIVAVGSETEPVSKNDEFKAFARKVFETVKRDGPDATASLEEERVDLAARLGENIVIRGAERFEIADGEVLAAYVHTPANKKGVLVRAKGPEDGLRELAMHLSFAAPGYMSRDEVPAEEVAAERAIYEKSPEMEGKPDQVRDKIIEGMLAKRLFAQIPGGVLGDQPWSREASKSTAKVLQEAGIEVLGFAYFSVE